MRAIVIDRTIPVGKFSVRAETLTIREDDDEFEFVWSIQPAPVRLEAVRDPDSGRVRLEHFLTRLPIWWRIRDDVGREYAADGGGSEAGEGERWRSQYGYRPAPPSDVGELLLTLSEIRPHEDVAEREIETIRVPLKPA